MPYNSGTGAYERRTTTVIDATPDGDTVAVAIDVKLDTAADDAVLDLNHHKTNGNHYPAPSVAADSRFLGQSPAGVVEWKNGVPAPDAALKDFSNVASGTIAPEKLAWANFPRGRNLIINGDFRVNQRAYVSGTNTTGANQYTLDRWRVVTSGQNITFSAYLNGNQVTAPAGGVEQVIEGINIEGGAYVLNWAGTATATVNGTARAKGESFTLTANTNATVRFLGGTVGLVQLEAGNLVTPFEHRHIGLEFYLCQRYFETSYNVGVAPGATSAMAPLNSIAAGSTHLFTINLCCIKRATPSATFFSPVTGASGKARNYSSSADVNAIVQAIGQATLTISVTGITGGNNIGIHYALDSEI